MQITGDQIIANNFLKSENSSFQAKNPANGEKLPTEFFEATAEEIDQAVKVAEEAFVVYRKKSDQERADFLDRIGEEIMNLGDTLLERCHQETGLPMGRLQGERGRTVNQLKLFAELLRDGTWVDARIDTAIPDRQPIPKPDIRQMQIALGPVGVFGASNFPLAFSVAGGDTASALAAGCTIVVKGHPAHPGTSELVGRAIATAVEASGMPAGTFSLVQGQSVEVGMGIVQHPLIKAIGFTGSFRGGKAIFDTANQRDEPIPVYAEMGSINPVFVLPEALKQQRDKIAEGWVGSLTLGVGQFCTNPGVLVTQQSDESAQFLERAKQALSAVTTDAMLTDRISEVYQKSAEQMGQAANVATVAKSQSSEAATSADGIIFSTSAQNFLAQPDLSEEVFGPSSLHVAAQSKDEMLEVAKNLEGHLTATLHATENDLTEYADLIAILERKVGRLLVNGFPTGVEVCHAMVHGGPYPATTDSRSTSVGTLAIKRFTRPISYQNFPQRGLPDALKSENPLSIFRLVNGKLTQDQV
ncbi:aldehyde dehydrogenase (NADP(+)) [Tunicatimonas pelagia]|uniref:aldehyde dehydrogenase (NADP(+)) n=1 Tax=Tunicatimonas pelagia TaxID=931531 RepID=UPI002665022E|nr:aldehyde dehydrogenase (NADP(+)) [Tunicatimonas pelagia]WKN43334.1 aldehyde dehydrogenase (NADP(+)) [Tunicatimonas pelagia]